MFDGKARGIAIAAGKQFVFAMMAATPYRPDSVDHMSGGKLVPAGDLGFAGRTSSQRAALSEQLRASGAMDGAIDASAAEQRRVGGIDDGVHLAGGDVAFDNDDAAGHLVYTKRMLLQGIFPAITTPFYPDGKLYHKKLEHNVDRYSKTPISGMVVLGSTGETVMLGDEEQREVLRLAAEMATADKVMVAGVGQESAVQTLAMAEHAAQCGYDVALVRTPSYYRPQMKLKPESLLAHYRFVADRSPLPVLLYSVPPFTAYDLPTEMVAELAGHPNIIGIKESSGNVEKIAAMRAATAQVKHSAKVTEIFEAVTGRMVSGSAGNVASNGGMISAEVLGATASAGKTTAAVATRPKFKMRTKEVGFQILAGAAQSMLPSFEAGASGAVLAFGACAPTACFEFYTAWKEGDKELAELKQQRISTAAKRIAGELGVPGTKFVMDLNGYYGGPARLPFLPLTAVEKAEIEK